MGRPTNEKKGMLLHVRVSEEMSERILQESSEQGISASEYVRERLSFVTQNSLEMEMRNITFVYGIEAEELLKGIKGLLNSELLIVRDGVLGWNLSNICKYLKDKGLI